MSKAEDLLENNRLEYVDYTFKRHGIDQDSKEGQLIYYAYGHGYHQAEKDLELTWEDIRIILGAENDILRECNSQKELVIETYPKGEDYYGEILKRFKERKENAKVNV